MSCTDNSIVNGKQIGHKYCSKSYYVHWVKLMDQLLTTINNCKNLFWFRDQCVDILIIKLDLAKTLLKIKQKIEKCNEIIKRMIK